MHETPRVDQKVLSVIINLEKGSFVGMILAKTPNGLDVVHRREITFFARSHLLL